MSERHAPKRGSVIVPDVAREGEVFDFACIIQRDEIGGRCRPVADSTAETTGITIAKQIEMHGGRIWVESTLGKGLDIPVGVPHPRRSAPGSSLSGNRCC